MPSPFTDFGSVISGTLQPRDLLPAFADALRRITAHLTPDDHDHTVVAYLLDQASTVDPDSDTGHDLLADIEVLINEYCEPYVYFGAHLGDAADFGFWPDIDAMLRDIDDKMLRRVSDLADVSSDDTDFMLVNDHGNVSYGYVDSDGTPVIVWSVV